MCVTGGLRGFFLTFPQIYEVLFKEAGVERDWYFFDINTEDGSQAQAVRERYPFFNCGFQPLHEVERQCLTDSTQEELDFVQHQSAHRGMSFAMQWYGVHKCMRAALDAPERYDLYVRVRADLFVTGRLRMKDGLGTNDDSAALYAPYTASFGGINDRFAFGGHTAMDHYANFYGSPAYKGANNTSLESKVEEWYQRFYNYPHHPGVHLLQREEHGAQGKYWDMKYKPRINGAHINSESRVLRHLFSHDLNVKVLDPEHFDGYVLQDSKGQLRVFGPDFFAHLKKFGDYSIRPAQHSLDLLYKKKGL